MGSVPNMANTVFNTSNSTGGHPAYFASTSTVTDLNWYMDSGASNHITHDATNLDQASKTYAKTNIFVGNGEKLQVYNTGVSSLPCQSQTLKLNHVLYASKVTKNLLSVSQLTCDNEILIEFDLSYCYIKTKQRGNYCSSGR